MAELHRNGSRFERIRYIVIGIVIGICLSAGAIFATLDAFGINPVNPSWRKFFSAYELLSNRYYTQLSQNTLLNGAVSGMVQSIGDPFTDYFSPKDTVQFQNELSGSMVGIGVQLARQGQGFMIQSVIPNAPAERAGIQAGDILEAVNGKSVTGLTADEVRQRIEGPKGTFVDLTVMHPHHTSTTHVRIKHDSFVVPTVYSKMLAHHVGYIGISVVGSSTSNEVKKTYSTLAAAGAKALVIDLRDNPGGYLDEAVKIAGVFIPEGDRLLSTVNRDGKTTVYQSPGPGTHLPVIVLMNGNTASAAEVLASALHHNLHSPLVGVKSFGKGTVQETAFYADGSGLKYTVAKWLTADGKWIHHVGLEPTDMVPVQPANEVQSDLQLIKAIQIAEKME